MATETKAGVRILTADEFWELPEEEGYRLELSRGPVVCEPAPGMRHGQVAVRLYRQPWLHVEREGRGLVSPPRFGATGDVLKAEDVLPGLRIQLGEIFEKMG